jgi:hypothetical protein
MHREDLQQSNPANECSSFNVRHTTKSISKGRKGSVVVRSIYVPAEQRQPMQFANSKAELSSRSVNKRKAGSVTVFASKTAIRKTSPTVTKGKL